MKRVTIFTDLYGHIDRSYLIENLDKFKQFIKEKTKETNCYVLVSSDKTGVMKTVKFDDLQALPPLVENPVNDDGGDSFAIVAINFTVNDINFSFINNDLRTAIASTDINRAEFFAEMGFEPVYVYIPNHAIANQLMPYLLLNGKYYPDNSMIKAGKYKLELRKNKILQKLIGNSGYNIKDIKILVDGVEYSNGEVAEIRGTGLHTVLITYKTQQTLNTGYEIFIPLNYIMTKLIVTE